MTITEAGNSVEFDAAREIFREYAESLPEGHVCFSAFEQELAGLESWYSLIFLAHDDLARDRESLAGAVAMRKLDEGVCEMKRLYVRAPWRGTGLGRQLVARVIDAARSQNYWFVRLDTMPEMNAAIALYRTLGFYEIPPYGQNPAGAICLEMAL